MVNSLRSLFEQLRPVCDLYLIPNYRTNSTVESLQRLKGSDHFLARSEISRPHLLPDFNCQRIIMIKFHTA